MKSIAAIQDVCRRPLGRAAGRWLRAALASGVLLLVVFGCEKPTPKAQAPTPVKVKVLEAEAITVSLKFSGSIEPLQTTSLAFKLAGTVQRLNRPPGLNRDVQVGDTLAKGTVIAEYDEGDLRRAKAGAAARVAQLEARVATAKDNLVIATRNYERYMTIAEGAVSKEARDDVTSHKVSAAGEVATSEHALADARVQLDQASDDYVNRQLIVPFDNATVAEKHIEPGERKAAQEVAFRLIDISSVHVTFGVPDTMVGEPALADSAGAAERVYLGQKLPVTAEAFEGRTFVGTVTKIAPQADPQTRTFLTELTLANSQTQPGQWMLRPGMIVTIRVGAEKDRKVMLLPMAAIHQGRSGADDLAVWEVVSDAARQTVRARKVALGGVYNNEVEVLPKGSEVGAGAKVVVTTAERLSEGATVQMMQDNPKTAATLVEAK
jgi:multidrug efflux system membrane fusion protein